MFLVVQGPKWELDHLSNMENGISVQNGSNSPPKKTTRLDNSGKVCKRTDYLSWDEYFMSVAFLSAQRSKDPSSQVGACIVNREKKIVGIGYNGMPNGCDDDELPWARTADDQLNTKYPYGNLFNISVVVTYKLSRRCSDLASISTLPLLGRGWLGWERIEF